MKDIERRVILHISDLHFGWDGDERSKNNRKLALEGIIQTLNVLEEEWKPTTICVSGDVGWKGSRKDYEDAEAWFRILLITLEIDANALFICPGNHDLDRTYSRMYARPNNAKEADEILGCIPIPEQYKKPFQEFENFCKNLKISPFKYGDGDSYLIGKRDYLGLTYVSLNSSWFSKDDDDKGKLWIGQSQIRQMEASGHLPNPEARSRVSPIIVIMHHPPEDLREEERIALLDRPNSIDYLCQRCHLLFTGHTHAEPRKANRIAEAAWHFTSGATYAGSDYFNSYRLIKMEKDQFAYRTFQYNPQSTDHRWKQHDEPRSLPFLVIPINISKEHEFTSEVTIEISILCPDLMYDFKQKKIASLIKDKQYDDASLILKEMLNRNPNDIRALNGIGIIEGNSGNYSDALTNFEKALSVDPLSIQTLLNKIVTLRKLELDKEALEVVGEVLKLDPGNIQALNDKGIILSKLGHTDEALKLFDELLIQDKNNIITLYHKGSLLGAQCKYEQALGIFNNVINIKPDFTEAWCDKGTTLFFLGLFEDSVKAFDRAISLGADYLRLWAGRCISLLKLEHLEEALNTCEEGLKKYPNNAGMYSNKGLILMKMEKFEEALEFINKAIDIKPNGVEAWHNKGILLEKLKRIPEALQAQYKALELNPNSTLDLFFIGYYHCVLSNYKESLPYFEKALDLQPNFTDAMSNKSCALMKLSRYGEAMKEILQALKIDCQYSPAWYNLASLYALIKNKEKAIQNLQKAIALDVSWKEKAKLDNDFKNLWNDPDFIALLK